MASPRMGNTPIKVRALYRAVKVSGETAPYDTLNLKVYYPCRFADSAAERRTGIVPVDTDRAPLPLIIFLPDEDVNQECYGWLASELAMAGFAVATYNWVCELKDGGVRYAPGVQRKRLARKRYGRKPSCPALAAIFSELKRLNRKGVLAGQLNLSRCLLGGHGLGGSMALLNANRDWFPSLCGAFSYAGHCLGDPDQGWDRKSAMPLAPDLPLLLIGGDRDSVLAADTAHLGGDRKDAAWAIEQSFSDGVKGKRGDRLLVVLEGAGRYTFTSPRDDSCGRRFLDSAIPGQGKALRKYLSQLIVTFCDQHSCGNPMSTADLSALADADHPMVARADRK